MDMGKDLPDYEEIPVPLPMPSDVVEEYKRIESALKKVLREDIRAKNGYCGVLSRQRNRF